ncbi:plastid transcriptionally active 5 [Artemisia annua]|uniref:Plastid transcriptionally active 5 n=1 Tax=Artemisia annua TaxID=35608 RepID=A0A2U1NHE9_ARTAN|nr:plastid transcriptionally active 5 [Artemisia annua]
MSSSLPLTFTYLHYPHHNPPKNTHSYLKTNLFSPSKFSPRPHICFTFNKNSSDYEREEQRWLREEQRWLREEQRWLREQERWEDEKEVLLNEIKSLRDEIEMLRSGGVGNGNVENVVKLLNVLKKEVSQIAESGSSGVPFVVEANAEDVEHVEEVKEVVEEVEKVVKEVEVKEVEVKEVKEVKVNVDKKKMAMLRVGSEGDQVQMLQEALLKLGFYCGEEDEEFSCFSSGTERAVKTWQSSIGVPETGVMTVELLERLFMDSGFKVRETLETCMY